MIDLNSFADGELVAQFDREFKRVTENMADLNTDPTKARKITVTLTFKGDKKCDVWSCAVQSKSTIVPATEVESKILLDYDSDGTVIGQELASGIKGQMFIDTEGDIATDLGEKVQQQPEEAAREVDTNIVVDLQRKSN
ncbi:replication terminator protein [Bacillus cereus]|uniref:replication terminator protein n=1 Tax=Bacillus cereus TaxID=1396 RepID=UPI000BF44CF9|nr:replication terminator protein [Bacillus cereus]PEW64482.1 replication terminator protein [Bacillus cereus]